MKPNRERIVVVEVVTVATVRVNGGGGGGDRGGDRYEPDLRW